MRKVVVFGGMLLLLCGNAARAQESETEPSSKAPEYRLNMQIGVQVPIALANRMQREAFRGLVATDLMLNIYTAKNVYVGVGGQYNLFQTRGPNNFKLKTAIFCSTTWCPVFRWGTRPGSKATTGIRFIRICSSAIRSCTFRGWGRA